MDAGPEGAGRDDESLDPVLNDWFIAFDTDRSKWLEEAQRIASVASGVCQQLGLPGSLELFGSVVSGLGSVTSDVDLVFLTEENTPLDVLRRIQEYLSQTRACYNITPIFQGKAPLLKLTDACGIEVDLVVNNHLGVRNTLLLKAYRDLGETEACGAGCGHVEVVTRTVKEWARRCGLIGTCDGMINSYAWTLLAIYFLQTLEVLPNLQMIAEWNRCPSVLVDGYDTRFAEPSTVDAERLARPLSGTLLRRFFQFYALEFDWRSHAVCMRLARPAPRFIPKTELRYGDRASTAWYIEDPFDQQANLAYGTTAQGRERILSALRAAVQQLRSTPANWTSLCPQSLDRQYVQAFLKLRLRCPPERRALVPEAVWRLLAPFGAARAFVRLDEQQFLEVYVRFNNWQELRTAQSINEQTIPGHDQPLALYISLGYGLFDELTKFTAYPPFPDGEPASAHYAELAPLFAPLPFGGHRPSPPPPGSARRGNAVPSGSSAGMNPMAAAFVPNAAAPVFVPGGVAYTPALGTTQPYETHGAAYQSPPYRE